MSPIAIDTAAGGFTTDGVTEPLDPGDYYVNVLITNVGEADAIFAESEDPYGLALDNVAVVGPSPSSQNKLNKSMAAQTVLFTEGFETWPNGWTTTAGPSNLSLLDWYQVSAANIVLGTPASLSLVIMTQLDIWRATSFHHRLISHRIPVTL